MKERVNKHTVTVNKMVSEIEESRERKYQSSIFVLLLMLFPGLHAMAR